jgi:phosphatidylglycerol:prolipoprotein diacylglycerol transferase
MRPELFQLVGISFYSYRVLLAASFIVCTILAVRASERQGSVRLDPALGMWALVGALLGARVFYVLQYESLSNLWKSLFIWDGGLVFYGGLIGGTAAVAMHWRMRGTPFLEGADLVAPYLAMGEAITRIGCFLNGCCYGAVTAVPWAVRFPRGSVAFQAQLDAGLIIESDSHTLACHPTELYMTAGLTVVFFALRARAIRRSWDGSVVCGYLLLYGILRFLVESLRGDSARSVFSMTVSQAISLALVLGSGTVFMWRYYRWTQSRPTEPETGADT